jgi:alanine-synthesizing transaminase
MESSRPTSERIAEFSRPAERVSAREIRKSHKLDNVCYEIRGPAMKEAERMEEEGHRILKLNIGNPAPFGFEAPEEILRDVIHNLPTSQGYSDSKGLFPARKAVMQYYQSLGILGVEIDDIFMGNGVSELVVMGLQGLLDNGDEVLVPAPDYPLWTAAVSLSGGTPVHYLCDEQSHWFPDLDDIRRKVTPRTKAIVVINPNNPTGAVYSRRCSRVSSTSPGTTTWWSSPTRSTTRSSTTARSTYPWRRWPTTCSSSP